MLATPITSLEIIFGKITPYIVVGYIQLQAMQMTFFFLPSILLSGFMFLFDGMPEWAQVIGNILPLIHCLNIVREILLKGRGFFDIL